MNNNFEYVSCLENPVSISLLKDQNNPQVIKDFTFYELTSFAKKHKIQTPKEIQTIYDSINEKYKSEFNDQCKDLEGLTNSKFIHHVQNSINVIEFPFENESWIDIEKTIGLSKNQSIVGTQIKEEWIGQKYLINPSLYSKKNPIF